MNKDTLIAYNRNTYIKICKYLTDSLNEIERFLDEMDERENYRNLKNLRHIYTDIFNKKLVSPHIEFKLNRVSSSFHAIPPEILDDDNSTLYIRLKLCTEAMLELDQLYGQRLSRLLKFYKNLFSKINNPSQSPSESTKEKYSEFLSSLREEIGAFVKSSLDREVIDQREKLSEQKLEKFPFPGFYHMTHINNLDSILKLGVLSHNKAHSGSMVRVDISNQTVNARRERVEPINNKSIHDYVPLYINPLNGMSYAKKMSGEMREIVLLEILPHIAAQQKEVIITDGNAASGYTTFYGDVEAFNKLDWEVLNAQYWCQTPDRKRIRCSEILIPEQISQVYIQRIVCNSEEMVERVSKLFPNRFGISIEFDKALFYS